ncbi:winged helix-turn-helix domain-containing protein [Streptomyces sp. NPDC048577]|uniref:winged helix-turn-helix domain-containing protein n=1 Tax=Streptomyces sp. NPDC048577 TaxID=3157209 RepID=UPI00341A7174
MQLSDLIAEKIATGEYSPDRVIPTPGRLAEDYGIAVLTARRAMRELRERGLIYTVPGKGSYVMPAAGENAPSPEK